MGKLDVTRRQMLMGAVAGTVATAGMAASPAKTAAASRPTICFFSKHLPDLNYPELAKALKDFGFPGVDLTVRPKGHVLPENAERDLPKAVEALRAEGIAIPMITTGLTSASDPAARPTLYTAAKLGVPLYKLGYYRYGDLTRLDETLGRIKREVEGLAAMGRHAGIQGGFHTHSGSTVGAVMWDNWWIQRDVDPKWMSYYFDPCHATIEGGSWGWKVGYHRLADRITMVSIKDFYWEKHNGEWKIRMCPLGEGMVRFAEFFKMLAADRFAGPLSLHFEYEIEGSTEAARHEKTMAAIAKDLAFVQKQVQTAFG